MIKFFRRIRQRLLSENKFSKYFLYAIGEIILVVIGILIALQINNWNEDRQAAKQEQLYLNRLLVENREDLETFSSNIVYLKGGIGTIKGLSTALKSNAMSDSSVVAAAHAYFETGSIFPIFSSSTSTFDDLWSTGNLKIIRNSSLRDKLVKHYAEHKAVSQRIQIGNEWAYPIDGKISADLNIMRLEPNSSFLFPDETLNDKAAELRLNRVAYLNMAAAHYWLNMDAIDQLEKLIEETSQIIGLLEEELN
ncbi:MAG: hypothetical protein KJO39_11810 [Bacteroidia bacterium]|nr:hypothetical protein [Bacteroidia bacterium]NNF31768.1 hypothetical protein [Flavobacteriaceae bacterium]NNK55282.1 hypothetical protein [Flavobacteriaceae bacterium]NNM10277.1 hypothetical protein [Flavobacteriaceae bacterium]